ncbi:hypothetical protein LINGRAHAP2_LOCUS27518 [Linum grandiflorum]
MTMPSSPASLGMNGCQISAIFVVSWDTLKDIVSWVSAIQQNS